MNAFLFSEAQRLCRVARIHKDGPLWAMAMRILKRALQL